jgi:hypothetical protein
MKYRHVPPLEMWSQRIISPSGVISALVQVTTPQCSHNEECCLSDCISIVNKCMAITAIPTVPRALPDIWRGAVKDYKKRTGGHSSKSIRQLWIFSGWRFFLSLAHYQEHRVALSRMKTSEMRSHLQQLIKQAKN